MFKVKKRVLALVLSAMLVLTAVPVTTYAAAPKMSKKSVSIIATKTVQLKVLNNSKKVKWSTSNKKNATVSKKGLVKGKKAGKATITAKVGKKTYKCKVTVKAGMNVTKKNVKVGSTFTLKVLGNSKKVKWSTSKKSVATVSAKGKVKAVAAGKATITAKVGGKKYKCTVTVVGNNVEPAVTVPVTTAKPNETKPVETTKPAPTTKAEETTAPAETTTPEETTTEAPTTETPTQKPYIDNEEWDYNTEITGKVGEFFIEPVDDSNDVEWDADNSAYHLTNNVTAEEDIRGFVLDIDYIKLLAEKVNATSIKFEYKFDSNKAITGSGDEAVYIGYYPSWYTAGQFGRTSLEAITNDWATKEIKISEIPTTEEGDTKAPFIMNTVGGLYIRNITITKLPFKPNADFSAAIEGENYTFFIEPMSKTNKVEWDSAKNAFHLSNTVKDQENTRGFLMNVDYINAIIKNTKAESITYEYMYDGQVADDTIGDKTIYTSFYDKNVEGGDWWNHRNAVTVTAATDVWQKTTIKLADIPKDTNGNIYAPFIMNSMGGMYVKNIKVNIPQVVDTLDISAGNITFTKGNDTGFSGGNNIVEFSADENGIKLADCALYSCSKLMFNNVKNYEAGLKLKFYIKATPLNATDKKVTLWLYNTGTSGGIGDGIDKEKINIPVQNTWTTVEANLDNYLTADGKLEGIAIGTFDYEDYSSGQRYTIEISKIEVVK